MSSPLETSPFDRIERFPWREAAHGGRLGGLPLGGGLTAMPAWLIPYWIADMLVTLGLILVGLGSAGFALLWLRARLGTGRR